MIWICLHCIKVDDAIHLILSLCQQRGFSDAWTSMSRNCRLCMEQDFESFCTIYIVYISAFWEKASLFTAHAAKGLNFEWRHLKYTVQLLLSSIPQCVYNINWWRLGPTRILLLYSNMYVFVNMCIFTFQHIPIF